VADGEPRWSLATIPLHWLNAVVVIGLIGLGWSMLRFFDAATRFDLYQLHKSFGVVAIALLGLRLAARAAFAAPPPMHGPVWETRAAHWAHVALYALTSVVVLAGWVTASSAPLPIPTIVFGLFIWPSIAPTDATIFAIAQTVHAWAAYTLVALIALHVAAALKHQFWDRDGLMRRMWV
jgi:cytochrome b561